MRSLPEARQESLSPREIVTAGLAVIGFVVCSVVLAKVAYSVVTLFLHGVTYAVVSLY
jgi:preprotein translocase subunit Sec61beta